MNFVTLNPKPKYPSQSSNKMKSNHCMKRVTMLNQSTHFCVLSYVRNVRFSKNTPLGSIEWAEFCYSKKESNGSFQLVLI